MRRDICPLVRLYDRVLASGPLFFLVGSCAANLRPTILSCVVDAILNATGNAIATDRVNLPISSGKLILPYNTDKHCRTARVWPVPFLSAFHSSDRNAYRQRKHVRRRSCQYVHPQPRNPSKFRASAFPRLGAGSWDERPSLPKVQRPRLSLVPIHAPS